MGLRVHCPVGTTWNDVTKSCDKTNLDSCRNGNEDVPPFSTNSTESPKDNSRPEAHPFQVLQSDLQKLFTKWMQGVDSTSQSIPQVKTVVSNNPENELKILSQERQEDQSLRETKFIPQPDTSLPQQKAPFIESIVRSDGPVEGNSTAAFSTEARDSKDVGVVVGGGNSPKTAENVAPTGVERAVEIPESASKMTEIIREHLRAVIRDSADPQKRQPKTTAMKSPTGMYALYTTMALLSLFCCLHKIMKMRHRVLLYAKYMFPPLHHL